MERQELTEIVCVVDRSGSMGRVQEEAIDGFNRFVRQQREEPGEALLTLTLFNDEVEVVYSGEPLEEVEPLTEELYTPNGLTAMLDAVGRSLREVSERFDAEAAEAVRAEAPDQVLFVILTDGLENASREFLHADVPEMIRERRQRDDWEFIFLAANIDAFQVAGHFNIEASHVDTFVADGRSVATAFEKVTRAASSFRRTGNISEVWSDTELSDLSDPSAPHAESGEDND